MKLSIITINFNNRDGLERTIKSVIEQTARHEIEYIVIDGGSTDGSVDVIKQYSDKIDFWVSEPDKGIYNAMNKGTKSAHGEYCQYLNSGDWLYSETTIESVLKYLDGENTVVTGNVIFYDLKTGLLQNVVEKSLNPSELSLIHLYHSTLSHQASFIKTENALAYPYDEQLKICSDLKLFCTMYLNKESFKSVELPIVYMDNSGVSISNGKLRDYERKLILTELLGTKIFDDFSYLPLRYYNFLRTIPKNEVRFKSYLLKINQFIFKVYNLRYLFKRYKNNN